SDQLEAAAARAGRPLVAFNFGIPGFGTGQELLVLERWISRIEPDVVVLQFSPNDVANISLPYAYYSPDRRVYRPFFDDHGEPMLHEGGRRRPSLWFAKGPLAGLRLRWLLDLASNRLDDLHYGLRGIAENRVVTDPATGERYDLGQMSFSPYHKDLLRESFPKLEALLARIARVCRDHGARLIVVAPFVDRKDTEGQRLATILGLDADVRLGIPPELLRYDGWSKSLSDGHHNYLANLYLARDLLAEVTGVTQEADARRAGWFDRVPSTLDFSDPQVSRYVYGDVKRDRATRSWVARGPSTRILLRAPGSAPHYRLSLRGGWLGGEGSGGGVEPGNLTLRTADVALIEEFPSSGDFALSVDLSEEVLMDGLLLLELGFEAAVDRGLELHRAELQ
ncbi:MAG: SGNH/GDSL hydrolase family protein, partial [bacterium]|nr:SGNH/GDSL hydrolase family protein [bacterium]